jgi:mannose-6-phosphate isomerase-like protein (cupin superfamily)
MDEVATDEVAGISSPTGTEGHSHRLAGPFVEAGDMIGGAPLPGWAGRFFHSEHMTFAHWDIAADASNLHEHAHPQEEVWNIVEGEVVLVVDGHERALRSGDAAIVASNVVHSAKVTARCRVIVTDFPRRDQLPGTGTASAVRET